MGQKKPFVLRLEEATLEAVEKWAEDEFRSTNGQLEWIINKALKDTGRLKKEKASDKGIEKSSDKGNSQTNKDQAKP